MSEPIFFESPQAFYDWLEEHHETATEVHVGFHKTHTGKRAMTWSESVDQALCFGWIDGKVNKIDDDRYMQRFTPRKPGSNWSKINVEKVAKLKELGLMRPAGLGVRGAPARQRGRGGVLRLAAALVPPHRHPPRHERQAGGDAAAQAEALDRGFRRRA
jgi:uncharacterized protein YdeI (YjbR/CyaY-like superfamily)